MTMTERSAIIREAVRLIEATPTDILVAYLPVLGQYVETPDLRLVTTDAPITAATVGKVTGEK